VRHGESAWNELKLVQGQSGDVALTARGIEQARSVADTLRQYRFDSILSSDLDRARQTAAVLSDALGLDVIVTPSLRERSFGVFEGGPLADLPSSLSGISHGVVFDDQARAPGGESLREVHARVAGLLEQLRDEPGERRLLVTHGGAIRAIRAYCAGVTMQNLVWDVVENCSVWTVDVPSDGPTRSGRDPSAS
jgi:probable phosphoglycerate mutase